MVGLLVYTLLSSALQVKDGHACMCIEPYWRVVYWRVVCDGLVCARVPKGHGGDGIRREECPSRRRGTPPRVRVLAAVDVA